MTARRLSGEVARRGEEKVAEGRFAGSHLGRARRRFLEVVPGVGSVSARVGVLVDGMGLGIPNGW